MHSLSISKVMWVDCMKTDIDYNSADECVTVTKLSVIVMHYV
jgi:hypothetical protein